MITAYIGLGSNLQQPEQQLKTALANLALLPNTTVYNYSTFYKTAPVGFFAQPDFINAVAELHTDLSARVLLHALHTIEAKQGRIRDLQKNGPRTLDLDLLLYGTKTIQETDLIVPHPRMLERAFVLVPLKEIAPHLSIFVK